MIFVTVGSQKFQFNRLLKEIDRLVFEKEVTEDIFAQIGYCDYRPKYYKYKCFLDRDEFYDVMKKCDKIITHGGTGTIMEAVKQGKKVIVVPRLKEYGEHVDNHQLQIVEKFKKMNLIKSVSEINELNNAIKEVSGTNLGKYYFDIKSVISSIDEFINS